MKLFGLKTCDTCRKARKALENSGISVNFVDVRENPLAPAELARFYSELGDGLINRRSTTWKGLSEADKAQPPVALLAAHPAVMKRPVFDTGKALFLGWSAGVQAELIPDT
ncbi:MAG: ArsC/Spx/MgsR family protein [Pseudomonadota bacterium]